MRCEVEIPKRGGDVPVECHLVARARVGAISGQLQGEDGSPIAGQTVQLTGPRNETLKSDERGTFAAVDVPAGTYRIGRGGGLPGPDGRARSAGARDRHAAGHPDQEAEALGGAAAQARDRDHRADSVQAQQRGDPSRERATSCARSPTFFSATRRSSASRSRATPTTPVPGAQHGAVAGARRVGALVAAQWRRGGRAPRGQGLRTRPPDPRRTTQPANRAKNRRVQFIIRAQSAEVQE